MLVKGSSILLIASLFAAAPVNAENLYTKSSPVLRVDASNYDRLIARSNHATILEFYAPWCGHCQNLKPAYEKAAKSLEGLAKVGAVNCDDDSNKAFCGQMGVQGFPTLKIITPSKKPGKPSVEDYQGARSAKAIVDAVVDRIPNHVKRVGDKDLDKWLNDANETAKAILFTEKGTTSPLIRSLAIDFLGSIKFAQVRNKESSSVEKFGITKFPTLVLLPGGETDSLVYDGEMKRAGIVTFLSQVAEPNADPAPKETKSSKKAQKSKSTKSATSTASEEKPTEEPKAAEESESNESEPASEGDKETTSSSTAQPRATPRPDPLKILSSNAELRTLCLSEKTTTCVLALLPIPKSPEDIASQGSMQALESLTEISHKHFLRGSKLFPFYVVPDTVGEVAVLKSKLGLSSEPTVEIIAVNARRGWWRRYNVEEKGGYGMADVEAWIDAIRLGEGSKEKLPEDIVEEVKETETETETETEPQPQPEPEPEPQPEPEEAPSHEEL